MSMMDGPIGPGRDYTTDHRQADVRSGAGAGSTVRIGRLAEGLRTGGVTDDGSFQFNEDRRFASLRGTTPTVDQFGRPIPQIGDQQPGLGPGASTGQIMDYVADHYPGMIGFFNSNPEIQAKLIEAAKWGWSPGKLQAEVQGTGWYRSTSAAARDFAILESSDPSTAQARVAATAAPPLMSCVLMERIFTDSQVVGAGSGMAQAPPSFSLRRSMAGKIQPVMRIIVTAIPVNTPARPNPAMPM